MKHADASISLERTPSTERAAAGLRLVLWTCVLYVVLFVLLYKLQTALVASWTALVRRETDPWLDTSIGAIESMFPALSVALGLGALRLGAALPGRGARRLARASAALFAPTLLLELAQMLFRRGYLERFAPEDPQHRRLFELQIGAYWLFTLALTVLLAATLLGVARSRRARVLAVAPPALALVWTSTWLNVRMFRQAIRGQFVPLVASETLGTWIAVATPVLAYLGVALAAHFASRGVGHERQRGTSAASEPYRDPHAMHRAGGHFEPDYELAAQGLGRFRGALALRVWLLVMSTAGTLGCMVLHSFEGTRELARIVPLGNLACTALMLLGLFRYGTVPRRGGARELSALALLLTVAAMFLELESYLAALSYLDGTLYPVTRLGVWSVATLARREVLTQLLSLAGVIVAAGSLAPAARPCGGRNIAPRAWLVSALLLVSGVLAFWFRTNALERRAGGAELFVIAGSAVGVGVGALVGLLALLRDTQHALERGAAPRVGVASH